MKTTHAFWREDYGLIERVLKASDYRQTGRTRQGISGDRSAARWRSRATYHLCRHEHSRITVMMRDSCAVFLRRRGSARAAPYALARGLEAGIYDGLSVIYGALPCQRFKATPRQRGCVSSRNSFGCVLSDLRSPRSVGRPAGAAVVGTCASGGEIEIVNFSLGGLGGEMTRNAYELGQSKPLPERWIGRAPLNFPYLGVILTRC